MRIGVWSIAAAVVMLSGCGDRYFPDRAAAVAYLQSHQQEFDNVAEEWAVASTSGPSKFCNFGPTKYRWQNTFIEKSAQGYSVKGKDGPQKAANLNDAATLSGVSSAVLNHWIDLTTRSKIYCIESGSDGLVEIMLAGSEWSPYGFRFAPKGNEQVYATLQHFAAQGGMENTDTKMNQVAGRWFYFEAKRF